MAETISSRNITNSAIYHADLRYIAPFVSNRFLRELTLTISGTLKPRKLKIYCTIILPRSMSIPQANLNSPVFVGVNSMITG